MVVINKDFVKRNLLEWIDTNENEIFNLTSNLVKIPSINYGNKGYEGDCQKYIAEWLKKLDLNVDVFTPDDIKDFDKVPGFVKKQNFENRPNVVTKITGNGNGRSLILNGHVDVVPPEPMNWSLDPFSGAIKEDKIYGRGSLDMKGGLASLMISIKALIKLGIKLKGDLIFESVMDEESSIANGTLSCIARGYKADAVIIPEPNNMVISPASLGGTVWTIKIIGKSGMGFSGEEVFESVFPMGKIIVGLEKYAEILNNDFLKPEIFKEDNKGIPVRIAKIRAGEKYKWGTPEECWLEVMFAPWPGISEKQFKSHFLGYMHELIENDFVLKNNPPIIESVSRYQPGLNIDTYHPLVKVSEKAYYDALNTKPIVSGALLACDAYMFSLYADMPAIILGPGGKNAHACDEYVNKKDLIDLVKIISFTILDWCGIEC